MVSERQRKWAPKVRTGCFTCKKRKKRCDEARPVCETCRKGGYVCDGYDSPHVKPCTIRENRCLNTKPESTVLLPADRSAGEHIYNSLSSDLLHGGHLNFVYLTSDHRCTQFFVARVAPVLATTKQWQTFWEDIIPLTSINETPVHHAMLALSTAYEGKFLNTDVDKATQRQISQAIQTSMVQPISINGMLILCRLLAAISQSAGDWKTAMIHLQHGWRVLFEAVKTDQVNPSLGRLLGPIFLCASTHAIKPVDDALALAASYRDSILKLDCIRSIFARDFSALNWKAIKSSAVRTSIMLSWSNMTRALCALVCPSLSDRESGSEPGTIPVSVVSTQLHVQDELLEINDLHLETGLLTCELAENLEQLHEGSTLSFEFAERLRCLTESFLVNVFLLDANADVGMFWSENHSADCDIDVHLLRLNADKSTCHSSFYDGQLSARLQIERQNQENYLEYVCPYRSGFLPAIRGLA